ncbi:DUF397 domain-containing protein [Amycolatopsis sp. cg5]|uniref:DUF397 domain-containing protein n=1 Tax=Amycolatopsis sp. cg5 TaxID=3238802 RepID=UPI0035243BFD
MPDQKITGEVPVNTRNQNKWRKSSRSINDGKCVEVLISDQVVSIRDSCDPTGLTLSVSPEQWKNFVAVAIDTETDPSLTAPTKATDKLELRSKMPITSVRWRSRNPPDAKSGPYLEIGFAVVTYTYILVRRSDSAENLLIFTAEEWLAFLKGLHSGDFGKIAMSCTAAH